MDPTVIVGYTTDSNVVGYTQNDFIWASMDNPSNISLITCPPIPSTVDCSIINADNSKDCFNQVYCKNKQYGEQILATQSVHDGADVRYFDTKNNYNMQLLTTINLGVGILGVGVFIFYNH